MPSNVFWAQGLTKVANDFKAMMDAGQVPAAGPESPFTQRGQIGDQLRMPST